MISTLIPQPFRDALIKIGKDAGKVDRPTDELAVVGSEVDRIRAECAKAHPNLFKSEVSHD